MKKLEHELILVEHSTTQSGLDITEATIMIKGHIEKKHLQIEVNELDIAQTPREKIVLLLLRLSYESRWCQSKKQKAHIDSKILGLEIALTYLN
jgi:hypothetical protein